MERVVDGFFSKAFRSPIQPAEIGRRLLRDMEGGKTVSVGAVYVPNRYEIHLGTEDFDRFEGLVPTLREEFGSLLRRNAAERHWQFPGPLVVDFLRDTTLASGRFTTHAEHDADAVAPPPPEPLERDVLRLIGSHPPKEWILKGRMVLGRLPTCEISLHDANASRQHAELVEREDGWWIVDLDSTNGTYVNGSLVKERRLMPGDRIQVGSSKMEFAVEQTRPVLPPPAPAPVPDATQLVSNPHGLPNQPRKELPHEPPQGEPGDDPNHRYLNDPNVINPS